MMTSEEIDNNYKRFADQWFAELEEARDQLRASSPAFSSSYSRIGTINAWRTFIMQPTVSAGALRFFDEAQNDLIVSHVLASLGCWQPSLKSLRSAIENVAGCLYYTDHSVELKQWQAGRHRLEFSKLVSYLKEHPELEGIDENVSGLSRLVKEYATLSRAVHASRTSFRMTPPDGTTSLFVGETSKLGQWVARERDVISGANMLLVCFYRTQLQGSAFRQLRLAIAQNLSESVQTKLTDITNVQFPSG